MPQPIEQFVIPFPERTIPDKHVRWLELANAGDYIGKKSFFYPFKTRFLQTYALTDGYDLQTITLKCWCGDGIFRGVDYDRPKRLWESCHNCGGTGIYMKKKIVLLRWWLYGRIFHQPTDISAERFGNQAFKEHFNGHIKHPKVDPIVSRRAMEKLMLRYEPRTFVNWINFRMRSALKDKRCRLRFQIYKIKRLIAIRKPEDIEVPF